MIICRSRGFLFIQPRKVASTSIQNSFFPHLQSCDHVIGIEPADLASLVSNGVQTGDISGPRPWTLRAHSSLSRVVRVLGQNILDYKIITMARNPWDRAISEFFWVRARKEAAEATHAEYMRDFEVFLRKRSVKSLSRQLLDRIEGRNRTSKMQQSELCMFNNEFHADHVIFYEDLEGGLGKVADALKIDLQLPTKKYKGNHRPEKSRDWRSFYSEKGRQLVAKAAKTDIDLFGYSFDATSVPTWEAAV